MSVGTERELRFAAAVSYRAATEAGAQRQKTSIGEAFAVGIPPERMIALIERHRVAALALDLLERFGLDDRFGDAIGPLRDRASEARRLCLALALRGAQGRRAIEQAGIPCLEFKGGPLLSRKLYGDLALRHCKDVDLIVPPERLQEADAVLREAGWTSGLDPVWNATPFLRRLSEYSLRDVPYIDPATGCQIELHTRFEHIPDPRHEALWWEAMRDTDDRRLSPAEFLFLVVHGTKHRWNRLKWLGDIAAIVDRDPDLVPRSAPLAARLGIDDTFPVLERLLADLYAMELPGSPRRLPARDGWRVGSCLTAMGEKEVTELTAFEELVVQLRNNRFRFSLFGGRTSPLRRLVYLAFQVLVRPKDIEALQPRHRAWIPLLPVLRVISIAVRYARHALHPVPGGAHR